MRVALSLALLLLGAAPAGAATVEVRSTEVQVGKGQFITDHVVVVQAAPGEVNRLAIARSDGIVVRDPGGGLTAGRACTGGGDQVICPEPVTRVTAELGDGPDTLEVAPPLLNVYVYAGDGDDVVTGASSSGGAGADQLTDSDSLGSLDGGPGPDRLMGAGGDDRLVGGEGADVLDGGAGFDEVSYEEQEDSIRVDLAAGAGGDDALTDVESVRGGRGRDVLLGTDGEELLLGEGGDDVLDGRGGPDRLLGAGGDDTIRGGAGDDLVVGLAGRDTLAGGAGDDSLLDDDGSVLSGGPGDDRLHLAVPGTGPSRRTVARCGSGRDQVSAGTRRARVAGDCEAAGDAEIVMLEGPRVRQGALVWRVRPVVRRRTRFEVRVRLAGGALAGRGSVRVRRGRGAVVRVRFDGAAREALRRAGPLRVRIAVLERGVRTAAWTTAV